MYTYISTKFNCLNNSINTTEEEQRYAYPKWNRKERHTRIQMSRGISLDITPDIEVSGGKAQKHYIFANYKLTG